MAPFDSAGASLTGRLRRRLWYLDLAVQGSFYQAGNQVARLDGQPRPCVSDTSEGGIHLDTRLATFDDQLSAHSTMARVPRS